MDERGYRLFQYFCTPFRKYGKVCKPKGIRLKGNLLNVNFLNTVSWLKIQIKAI